MTPPTKYVAALLACLALVVAGCGSSGTVSGTAQKSPKPTQAATCTYAASTRTPARKVQPPPSKPTQTGSLKVTITTNFGNMAATLDGKNAPCAVNAFLSLAKQGYYDKTICHRVSVDARGFHILQCGDPTATGGGDPGYQYAEEVKGTESYAPGTIAMAKATAPNTTGAQFFVVFGPTQLQPQYTVLGQLTPAGLKVAKKAAAAAVKGKPNPYDGAPATKVKLLTVK
ncbi:MAG: peptidylprolyl isomerase [Actinomycetota bacterium]|nr:peptidylprolyl isomerase [Actinomycetota bacterium]